MKKHFRLTLLIALCFVMVASLMCFVGCNSNDKNETTKPEYGKIQGVVVDKDGDPLEDAYVYYTDNVDDYVQTDEDGNFEIKSVKVGDVTLKVSLTGYTDKEVTLKDGDFNNEGLATTNIQLEAGKGTITGKVVLQDYSDVPVAGATVNIGAITATTDANGKYTLENVPMDTNDKVYVRHDGYKTPNGKGAQFKSETISINFSMEQEDLDILSGLKPYSLTVDALDPAKRTIEKDEIRDYFIRNGEVEYHEDQHFYCLNSNVTTVQDEMKAFMTVKVKVDEDHKFVTAYANVFENQNGESSGAPCYANLGLHVLEVDGVTFETSGNVQISKTYDFVEVNTFNPNLQIVTFDLSEFNDKTVTLILGTNYGYHCNIASVEFSKEAPKLINADISGLGSLRPNYVEKDEFNGDALKSDWTIGGAAQDNREDGVWLNSTGPWKAHEYDDNNPQPVNSYMYVTKEITAENNTLVYTATIKDVANCIDTAPGNEGIYYPYLQVYVIDADGNILISTGWESWWAEIDANQEGTPVHIDKGPEGGIDTWVTDENKTHTFTVDLSEAVGKEVTVVIACNVGYNATITEANFTSSQN